MFCGNGSGVRAGSVNQGNSMSYSQSKIGQMQSLVGQSGKGWVLNGSTYRRASYMVGSAVPTFDAPGFDPTTETPIAF